VTERASGLSRTVGGTRRLLAATLSARDAAGVTAGVAVAYTLLYLAAVGALTAGDGEVGLTVVRDPLSRLFDPSGPLAFEPVALLELGVVDYLFSPPSLALAAGLGALVGLNAGASYLRVRRPGACGLSSKLSALSGLPALLSGTACCGPLVLLALGVQATGVLLTAFAWLTPVATLLLVASLLWLGRGTPPAPATA
jgi:hypothetical protein